MHAHLAVFEPGRVAVHFDEARPKQLAGHLVGRVDHQIEGVAIVIGEVLVLGELLHLEQLVEQELDVA